MNTDKRKHTRYPVRLAIRYPSAHFLLSDYTKSISKGGVAIDSDKDLEIGTEFVFEMTSPDLSVAVEVKGKVVWARPNDTGKYTVGIEYIFPDEQRRQQLQQVIESIFEDHKWERQRKHPRVPVSIEVHGLGRAWVVRNLSLGGAMLQAGNTDELGLSTGQQALIELRVAGQEVGFAGEIVWVAQPYTMRGEIVPGRFAIRFKGLEPSEEKMINQLMCAEATPQTARLVVQHNP